MNSVPVDVRHRVHLYTGLLQPLLLSGIETSYAHQCNVGGIHLGAPAYRGQLGWAEAQ
jgi:hypothetical protein